MSRAEKKMAVFLGAALLLGAAVRFFRHRPLQAGIEVAHAPLSPLAPRSGAASRGRHKAERSGQAANKKKRSAAPVPLNRATLADLIRLPGLGAASAGKIIAYRREYGPFKEKSDLLRVEGMTLSLYRRIEPQIVLE